jgi:hypothetical protein
MNKETPSVTDTEPDGEIEVAVADVRIPFDEDQRQMVVLALAELAVARPGWLNALRGCAERIDSAELFRDFTSLHET